MILEAIRKRIKGWIGYALVAGICLTFALWGIGDYLGAGKAPVAAEVNGEEISQRELDFTYQRVLARQSDDANIDENQLKSRVLDELINSRIQLQDALDLGLSVSTESIFSSIRAREEFQVNGEFSRDALERLLYNNGYTLESFIEELKKDTIKRQLRSAFASSAFTTDKEVDLFYNLLNQEREVEYTIVTPAQLTTAVSVTDQEIIDFYTHNQDLYRTQEFINAEYLELKQSDLLAAIEVSEDEILTHYQENEAQYVKPERRQLAHIQVDTDDELREVKAKLDSGMSFAEAAKTYSKDIVTAKTGGLLGWFSPVDELPDQSFSAAFNLAKVGDITEPTKTDYGIHIIKLLDLQPEQRQSLEQVRPDIEQLLKTEIASEQFIEMQDTLSTLTYEHPDTLEVAADELGLEIKTSGDLTTTGVAKGVFSNKKLISHLFSDEVKLDEENTEVIEVLPQHVVVARVKTLNPSVVKPLDEVKTAIKASLTTKKQGQAVFSLADSIAKAMNEDTSADFAKSLTWETKQSVKRHNRELAPQLSEKLFKVAIVEDTPRYHIVSVNDTDYAVFRLLAINNPEAELDDDKKAIYAQSLLGALGNLEYLLHVVAKQDRADISKN